MNLIGHFTAIRATNVLQNSSDLALREVSPDASEEQECEKELQISEEEYILAPEKLYTTAEDVQKMIEAALKIYD